MSGIEVTASSRIGYIQKTVLHPQLPTQQLSEGLNPVALGGVMTGRKIVDSGLTGDMGSWLGNFTTDIGVTSHLNRLFDKTLSAPGTESDTTDLFRTTGDM